MISSASGREVAERCNRKYYHNRQLKVMKIPREVHGPGVMNTGSIFHAILEARYLNFENPIEYAFDIEPYNEYPDISKDQHNKDFITLTYLAYCNRWPMSNEPDIFKISSNLEGNDGEFSDIPALEYHWLDKEPVGEYETMDQGFIDRIVVLKPPPENVLNEDGIYIPEDKQRPLYSREPDTWEIWPTDTKTTSQDIDNRNWYLRHCKKIQFALYMRYMRNNIHNVTARFPDRKWVIAGFMVDSIMHVRSKRKFRRLWLRDEYTVEKCDKIIYESDKVISEAMENPDEPNYDACMDFRKECQFYNMCHSDIKDLPIEKRLEEHLKREKEKENEQV